MNNSRSEHGPYCDAVNQETQPFFICNAGQGHEGDHVAYVFDQVIHTWPSDTGLPPGSLRWVLTAWKLEEA